MAKKGRPGKYKDEFVDKVYNLSLLGLVEDEIAKVLGIAVSTLNLWKKKYPDFMDALKRGRSDADSKVAKSLYQRACGYSCKEDKVFCSATGEVTVVPIIKHYPPDPTSMIFWLKNRQPARWRDKPPEVSKDDDAAKPVSIEFVVEDGRKNKG